MDQVPSRNGAMVGKTVLHYQILAKIGAGGMGVVWKALDINLEREVALKFLPATATADPARRQRFLREARAASNLNHPNIVTIFEINSEGSQLFIAMELIRGLALSEVLRRRQRLDPGVAVEYAVQLCAGLGATHRAGIVHRDIKPSNIMLTDDGVIKILDFGLAKLMTPLSGAAALADPVGAPITSEGVAIGTIPYMSPEQASGDEVGPRSDVFSTGVVLYEMLSGRRPFAGLSRADIMRAVISSDPPPLSSVAPDVPEALAQIVSTCLQKRPDARYRDAGEIAGQLRALDRAGWPRPISDQSTVTVAARRSPLSRLRRNSKWLAAGGILALAVALFAGYKWWPFAKQANPSSTAAASLAQTEDVQRAQAYLQRFDRKGSVDSAIALLEGSSRRAGAGAVVYATLAEAYVRKYNESTDKQWLPRAVETGRRAVTTTDDLAAGHVSLGMALAASGQRGEAVAEFERARDLNPLSSPAHVGLARLRSGEEAERLFQQAVRLGAGQWIPLNELAAFYHREARYDESIAVWKQALEVARDNVSVVRNLGVGFHMKGQYAEAADHFQRALALDDSSATTWANLGTARYFQGRYREAASAAERATELAEHRYLFWGNLGDDCRWAEGLKSKAAGAYQTAIRLARERLAQTPQDAAVRSSLAAYLAKSGDTDRALAELAPVGQTLESEKGVLFKAALVYELAGKREQALDVLERAILAGYSMHEVANEPELGALRSDPRYAKIAFRAAASRKR